MATWRVRAGLTAMANRARAWEEPDPVPVSLFRGGEKIPMGKREAQFVTLRQLREEVGNDACRFFYLMRSHDQPLDFDLELAKSRSNENPVYYIQYAHARVASVLKQLGAKGFTFDLAEGLGNATLLTGVNEQARRGHCRVTPEALARVRPSVVLRTPLVYYLRELATAFHTYYNAEQFIVPEAPLRNARLCLVSAAAQVIRNGLTLLGVTAPEHVTRHGTRRRWSARRCARVPPAGRTLPPAWSGWSSARWPTGRSRTRASARRSRSMRPSPKRTSRHRPTSWLA